MKKRILFLSFYYYPDIGPGALRAKSIVDSLIKESASDVKIDILTSMPNRYPFSKKILTSQFELSDKVSIYRFELPKHKNRIFDQVVAFASFALSVQKFIFKKKWDIVVATSGRLFTASLAKWVSMQTGAKLYLDIRDLFVDTISHIFKKNIFILTIPFLYLIQKWTLSSVDKINIVSAAFLPDIKKIAPNVPISIYSNGVDKFFLKKNFIQNKSNKKPTVLYAGNIGDGQALDKIIPIIAKELKNVNFKIIGDGSAKKLLIDNNLIKSLNNVEIINPIFRQQLLKEYQKADILFLHLNNLVSFKKVLPSKIFEYAATGKPILAGVSGYSAEFLKNNVQGVEIFEPNNVAKMKIGLHKLLNGPKIFERKNFCNKFDREKIIKKLTNEINLLLTVKEKLIKPKILLVHRYFWPDKTSCSNILYNISKELSKLFELDILTSYPSYLGKTQYINKKISYINHSSNMSIKRLSLPNETKNKFIRITNGITMGLFIIIKCIYKKYDVIISTTTPPVVSGFFSALVSKFTNVKFIYFCMDINPEIGKKITSDFKNILLYKFLLKIDKWTCQTANLILVHSKDMLLSLQQRYPKKINNIRIMRHFSPETIVTTKNIKNNMFFKPKSKLKIIYAGNIGRFQEFNKIFEAMHLVSRRKDIELLIIGNGTGKSFFKEKAKREKVNIKFLNYVPLTIAKQIIKQSDIGLMTVVPNIYRFSSPSKIPSYLEQGKPIIAIIEKKSQIAKDIASKGYGIVVDFTNNKHSLAKTLIQLADNKKMLKTKSLNAKKVYNKYFSHQLILNQWKKLTEEVIARK